METWWDFYLLQFKAFEEHKQYIHMSRPDMYLLEISHLGDLNWMSWNIMQMSSIHHKQHFYNVCESERV